MACLPAVVVIVDDFDWFLRVLLCLRPDSRRKALNGLELSFWSLLAAS